MLQKTILDNGLMIITDTDNNAKTTTISYTVNCGSYDENEDNRGIAHFTEHMLFKGTINRNSQDISESIEEIGGILNACTGFEYTQYHCTVLSDFWKIGIDVLSDMIWNNLIPEEEFEREKQVVLEELKMYNDDPNSRVIDLLFIKMFPSYLNRQKVGGTLETVSKIKRGQMIQFIDQFYVPNNIFVTATGNINHDELVNFIKNYSKDVDFKCFNIENKNKEFIPDKLDNKDLIEKMDISQSHLCWGLFSDKPENGDSIIADVVTCILGGNSSSRLYQIIREQKGLAYTVSMDAERFSDTTILSGYVGLDGNNIKSVKEIVIAELNKLKTEEISDKELERSKAFIKGITAISFEKTNSQNKFIVDSITTNCDPNVDVYIKEIEKVNKDDIKNFASKYFREDNLCFTEVIPRGQE